MRRVFADSSILIAGAGSRTGASRAVLTMAEIGLFKLVISQQVLDECERNLRKKGVAQLRDDLDWQGYNSIFEIMQ